MWARSLRMRRARIEDDMKCALQRMEELKEDHKSVQAQLDALYYPVLSLPVEIISEIFTHCLPVGNATISLSTAPLVLLGICKVT